MLDGDSACAIEAVCYPDGVDAAVEQGLALLQECTSKDCTL